MNFIGGGTKNKTINTPERRRAIITMTNENFQAAARHVEKPSTTLWLLYLI